VSKKTGIEDSYFIRIFSKLEPSSMDEFLIWAESIISDPAFTTREAV
jgi:hypothetical protein